MAAQETDDIVQQEILEVALRLYQKFGPDKVTMDDVANATGRSRSSLYYYYKNRDDIFQAVLGSIARDVGEKIRHAVAKATTLNDRFYAFGVAKLKTSEDWKSIFTAMWLAAGGDSRTKHAKTMDVLHKKLIEQESTVLKEILSAAIQQNEISPISADEQDTLAFIIYSGIRGMRNEVHGQHSQQDMKAAMRLLADMTVKWLRAL